MLLQIVKYFCNVLHNDSHKNIFFPFKYSKRIINTLSFTHECADNTYSNTIVILSYLKCYFRSIRLTCKFLFFR